MLAAGGLFALSAFFVFRSSLQDRKAEPLGAYCVDRPAAGIVPAEYSCEAP
jgi:hypothetical protein